MWTIIIKFIQDDRADEEYKFAGRPVISEGPHLVAVRGEVEGEIWIDGRNVAEIRVRPPENQARV